MQKWLLLLFPVFLTPGPPRSHRPVAPPGWPEWSAPAFVHLKRHAEFFEPIAESGPENTMALCIGMPELIRYALFRDYFETTALETLYLRYGTAGADFSIGWFQIKPSFAEALENELHRSPTLAARFADLSLEQTNNRSSRLDRLRRPEGQYRYLQAFVAVLDARFAGVKHASPEDKLRFYATVYNCGLHLPATEIQRRIQHKHFPFGAQSDAPQMAYGDLAVAYWQYLPTM